MAPSPVVAVCTNRTPEAVAEALSALREQVPEGRLAVVASGTGADLLRRAFPSEVVLEEPRSGLSRARNRALDWAGGRADVVAYVDDDAVVEPGWWTALEVAWAGAAEDVACIGGPIRPRFAAAEPRWLSEPLLPALTLLDLGPEARELDPGVTNVYGANISFRVASLQRIGGFDPAYGHSGSRAFFGEEDQAQRALAELGMRTLYDPTMAVEHVIPAERVKRSSFVRRRFAYGRALGKRGGRGAGLAARQALTSGAGALVALVTARDRLFMERLVRASENVGVLAGRPGRR